MGDKIITMDSKYRKKHYPKGFFAAMAKGARGGGIILIVCGLVLALMGGALLYMLIAMSASGAVNISENMGEFIFFGIVGLVFFIPGLLVIWFGVKRCRSKESDWLRKCVEASGYPESVIRDFANQAVEDGTQVMALGTSRTMGILSRDYIFFYNLLNPCVIKIADIEEAYLVETSYTIHVNGKAKTMYQKNIMILSNHKTDIGSEAKEDTVRRLLDILTDRNPTIDTDGGRLLSESEYEDRKKALQQ